jgi:hypothetical protein
MSTNAARLRAAIDSGQTGDKVAGSDPAAAPLGTDEEASGAAPSSLAVAYALRNEVRKETAAENHFGSTGAFLLAIVLIGMVLCGALWMGS